MRTIDKDRYIKAFSRITGIPSERVESFVFKKGLNSLIENPRELLKTPVQREKHQAFLDLYEASEIVKAELPILDSLEDICQFALGVMTNPHLQETLLVISLDENKRVTGYEEVGQSSAHSVRFNRVDLWRNALRNNSRYFIEVHNHPSGTVLPSKADINTVKESIIGAHIAGLDYMDSIIVDPNSNKMYSFRYQTNLFHDAPETIQRFMDSVTPSITMIEDPEISSQPVFSSLKHRSSVSTTTPTLSRESFNKDQLFEIDMGSFAGLHQSQIALYAKTYLDAHQMRVLREALEDGYPHEIVERIAHSGEDWLRMREEREQWRILQDTTPLAKTIWDLKRSLERGTPFEFVPDYHHRLTSDETAVILRCLELDVPMEHLTYFARDEYSASRSSCYYALSTEVPFAVVKEYASPDLSDLHLAFIFNGLKSGLTHDQVKLYANPEYKYGQLSYIEVGLNAGLRAEEMCLYASPNFDEYQMSTIQAALRFGLTTEQVKTFADPSFTSDQMYEIREGFYNGLSIDQVKTFANPDLSADQIAAMRDSILSPSRMTPTLEMEM